MDEQLSDDDLDAIEARVQAAAPGPWIASVEGRDHVSGSDFILTGGDGPERGDDMYVTFEATPASAANLDFIAAARQDIPRLLAEVRRLRGT